MLELNHKVKVNVINNRDSTVTSNRKIRNGNVISCETLNPLQVLGFPEVTGIHQSVAVISYQPRVPRLQELLNLESVVPKDYFLLWTCNQFSIPLFCLAVNK